MLYVLDRHQRQIEDQYVIYPDDGCPAVADAP